MVLGCFVLYLILCGREGVFMCDLFKMLMLELEDDASLIGSCSSEMAQAL